MSEETKRFLRTLARWTVDAVFALTLGGLITWAGRAIWGWDAADALPPSVLGISWALWLRTALRRDMYRRALTTSTQALVRCAAERAAARASLSILDVGRRHR